MGCVSLVGSGSRTSAGGSGIWVACHRPTNTGGDLVRMVASVACKWCGVVHVMIMQVLHFIERWV